VGREVDDLGGVQRFGDFRGEKVRVYPQGFSIGTKGDGRDQRYDLLGDEFEDEILVDALDFAGEELVHATDDAEGQRAHGIGDHGLQGILREAFEDEVGDARAGANGEIERGCVGDAGAVVVGDGDAAKFREFLDLVANAVDEHDLDAEAAEYGDVDEQVAKIFVGDDGAVDGDNKDLALKTGDVFQDAAQIVGLDRSSLGGSGYRRRGGREGGAGAVAHGSRVICDEAAGGVNALARSKRERCVRRQPRHGRCRVLRCRLERSRKRRCRDCAPRGHRRVVQTSGVKR